MGGGTFGNRTAVAEYNIWADPEAAAAVFDVRRADGDGRPRPHPPAAGHAGRGSTPCAGSRDRLAAVLADLFGFYSAGYRQRDPTLAGAAVHDPCAVLALTHPELFERASRTTSPSRRPAG